MLTIKSNYYSAILYINFVNIYEIYIRYVVLIATFYVYIYIYCLYILNDFCHP